VKVGVLFNRYGVWIGAHHSTYNKRLCINVLPMLTVWIVFEGGVLPKSNVKN